MPLRAALLLLPALVVFGAGAAAAAPAEEWLTVHGFRNVPDGDLVEVNPTPLDWGQQLTVELRASRREMRTSFKNNRYRSYTATAAIDCDSRKGWYLSLRYYQQPMWAGPVTAEEAFQQGEAPVAFKDVPGDTAQKIVLAACKLKKPRP